MNKIYIAGKISGECETPELMETCQKKFNDYGLQLLYPPNGEIIPYTITDELNFVTYFEGGSSYTHGLLINRDNLGKLDWSGYMKNDISILITCTEAHFLHDWQDSKGAKIEHQLCLDLGIPITYVNHTPVFKKTLEQLFKEFIDFSVSTFKEADARISITKLQIEVRELLCEISQGKHTKEAEKEYVDCIMCLLHSMAKGEITVELFRDSFEEKLNININRTWARNENGTYSHVKQIESVYGC